MVAEVAQSRRLAEDDDLCRVAQAEQDRRGSARVRVVMATCFNYRDTWDPFLALFSKFWRGSLTILTDRFDGRRLPWWVDLNIAEGTWCEILAQFATFETEPIALLQDDFFLNAPIRHDVVIHAQDLLRSRGAGCVRLYPCPGADESDEDPYFGLVSL